RTILPGGTTTNESGCHEVGGRHTRRRVCLDVQTCASREACVWRLHWRMGAGCNGFSDLWPRAACSHIYLESDWTADGISPNRRALGVCRGRLARGFPIGSYRPRSHVAVGDLLVRDLHLLVWTRAELHPVVD